MRVMAECVIDIQDLVVDYHHHRALQGLTLQVRQGEIFGFLGPNGAGKSTAIKTLLGLLFPTEGSVRVHGLSPDNPASRQKVGFLPEEASYYRFLTPVELLIFYGRLFGIPRAELKKRTEKLLQMLDLSEVAKKRIGTFSKGMMQKVSLAQTLINEPDTLILDEPTSGLDPLARLDLRRILVDLRKEGKTVFFSSHELSEVELLCDSIAILKAGRLVKAGSLDEVLGHHKDKNLERFFLETMHSA